MKKIAYILLVAISFILPACSTCNLSHMNQIKEIQFGYSGGFANKQVTYALNYKGEVRHEGKIIRKISCDDVERIFNIASSIEASVNEPDNVCWFIDIKGKVNRKWTWGGQTKVDKKILELYNELNNLK